MRQNLDRRMTSSIANNPFADHPLPPTSVGGFFRQETTEKFTFFVWLQQADFPLGGIPSERADCPRYQESQKMNVLLAEIVTTLEACSKLKARGIDLVTAYADMRERDPSMRLGLSLHKDESNADAPGTVTLELGTTVHLEHGDSAPEAVLTALASAIAHLTGVGLERWLETEPRSVHSEFDSEPPICW